MEKVKVTKKPKANFETKKLSLLVLIVNQGVGDVYIEQLYSLESNLQLKNIRQWEQLVKKFKIYWV